MRIGVYGGSFNPPHTGHALAAAELIEKLALDRLLIVPAADPPHKALALGSPAPLERLELCRTAFRGVPKAELCDIELRRDGKSYTVDTLAELKAANPGDSFFLVMGTDMFILLHLAGAGADCLDGGPGRGPSGRRARGLAGRSAGS